MRERINRLARGIIDNGSPELVLAPERVEASVQSMGTKSRDLFTWSPMAVRGRFLILCAYRPVMPVRFWET